MGTVQECGVIRRPLGNSGAYIFSGEHIAVFWPQISECSALSPKLQLFPETPLLESFNAKDSEPSESFHRATFESCSWILFSRCAGSLQALAPSLPSLGNSAREVGVQKAEQVESTGCSKRRVTEEEEEERFINEDNKKSRMDGAGAGHQHALERPQEAVQTQASDPGEPQELAGVKTSREPELGIPLGRKWLLLQTLRAS